jgi:hypothetical protein
MHLFRAAAALKSRMISWLISATQCRAAAAAAQPSKRFYGSAHTRNAAAC